MRLINITQRLKKLVAERVHIHGSKPDLTKTPHIWLGAAGLFAVVCRRYCVHFFVKPRHWVWGHEVECYDSLFDYYGAGPLFKVVVDNYEPPCDPKTCSHKNGVRGNNNGDWICVDCWTPLEQMGKDALG